MVQNIIYPDKPKEITPTLILNVICDHFGVKPDDITSQKRNSEFVVPRQVAMYLCRDLTTLSLQGIGDFLGRKDNTFLL